MLKRFLAKKLRQSAAKYPVVGLIGPRQSGKTTLAKAVFSGHSYVSLEKPSDREFALQDPEGFLGQFRRGVIIDEAQRAPQLFSYIQTRVDQEQKAGKYILTGSQNFSLLEKISQSLAGRISLHKLLPFSLGELQAGGVKIAGLKQLLFSGGYPRIYDKKLDPTEWLANYVTAYLERDVRSIKNIGDLSSFQRFLRMCAFRSGKLINLSALANDCGITHNTAKAWLSVLEASFIVFLLNPYYKNFNKRLVKSPKLYFYDPGLMCFLMGVTTSKELDLHPEIGAIFETFVISELAKIRANQGSTFNLYFWRDKLGKEIDCLVDKGPKLLPIEIKAGQTITADFFKNLSYWKKLTALAAADALVVYGGQPSQKRSNGQVLSWRDIDQLAKPKYLG